MKNIIVGIFIGIIVGLLAGYYIRTKFLTEPIQKDYVKVTVQNKSGQTVKLLKLNHEKGSVEMQNLANMESVDLIFKNPGENLYQIFATFDNDSIISSKGEYVESGYILTETIFEDRIITDRNTY